MKETLQRQISLREFNKGAVGFLPSTDRVDVQCGMIRDDIFSGWRITEHIVLKMREHNLTEKFGLSFLDCMAMRADIWQRLLKDIERPGVKRSQTTLEVLVDMIRRLEEIFAGFIGRPKAPPQNNKE